MQQRPFHQRACAGGKPHLQAEACVLECGAGRFAQGDALALQERLAVQARPDGRDGAHNARLVDGIERAPIRQAGKVFHQMIGAVEVVAVVALHHIGARALSSLEELLEHATVRKVVGLDDADVLARRLGQTHVQRRAITRVGLVNHENPLVTGSIVMQDSRRAIRRAVVDADDFDIAQRLPAKRIQTLRQKPLHVINRNKNRNLWSGHFELLPHQPKCYRPSKPAAFKPNLLSYSI